MKGLTDIPGIRVGHASDFGALTGVTVVLCEGGAVAGVDIGGMATGTQEMDVLSPLHITPVVHAVTLAGGSAFGSAMARTWVLSFSRSTAATALNSASA